MTRATPEMRDFAERLIAHEIRGNSSSATKAPTAFRVCEKLRPYLTTLMGRGGFRALLTRALTLAKDEIPRLGTLQIKEDGSLEGLAGLEAQVDPKVCAEHSVVLLAQLLGLLEAFIGEKLLVHLVREVWPKLPLHHPKAGTRDKK
jgi:hypothetical protein